MPKSLAQLEKEYAKYVIRTKRPRATTLRHSAPVVAILSRHITTMAGGKALWGKFRHWGDHKDNVRNLKDAMQYAVGILRRRHIGSIVYVTLKGSKNLIPLWEAKWGHDGVPFISWKPNPVASLWQRRLES